MPVYCAICGDETADYSTVYFGKDGFDRPTYGLCCRACRDKRR